MKTIITLDKANQAFGFPQLDGNRGLSANTVYSSYAHFGTGNPTPYLGSLHNVEITASGSSAPLTLIGGSGGVEVWTDSTPTKAIWFGAATPGLASDGDIHLSTYSPGGGWDDRIVINNETGNVKILGLTADTSDTNLLSVDGTGVVHTYPLSGLTGSSSTSGAYLPLSGGTVTGDTYFTSGLTANTISATTYLNVNAVTGGSYSNGTISLSGSGTIQSAITGFTKYFTTGSTPTGVVINSGDRWYNTNNGIELVYIDDGNSSQWVQPANTPGPPGYSNLMITSGITTSAVTLSINTNYYGVNYNGNVNLTLPNPSGYDGYNMTIKDEGGYSSTYRIRLTPLSGLIDGNSYVDMNLNYIALHLVARNNNWWLI